MIKLFFPFNLQLHILQLEEYSINRFFTWIIHNFFKRSYIAKKKLVWTSKAKFIFNVAIIYFIVLIMFLTYKFGFIGLIISLLIGTQPYILLIAATLTLRPKEIITRIKVKSGISNEVSRLKHKKLQVIGVAGSYGKTSVKEFLYTILRTKYSVLRTPESYNTLFGVEKVIKYELDSHYDFFICEMGAYKIGEIAEICSTVHPDHAILTGINEQHLDRFKHIQNTICAKFEIIKCANTQGVAVANGCNENVFSNYKKYRDDVVLYGRKESGFYIKDYKSSSLGTSFTLVLGGKDYEAQTKLVGYSNLENILAASTMAFLLKVEPKLIVDAIKTLEPVSHRLELTTWPNGLTVIDDAYSSNVTGFKAALDLLGSYAGYEKIIATPGIVELGAKTSEIHKELGKQVDTICDRIFLIGKNDRTLALEQGITNKNKIVFISSLKELQAHISNPDTAIVLIENDLPDNY